MIKLTIEEKHCINKHLRFYQELENGRRRPATRAQDRFVMVCRGHQRPETIHEHAYLKWRNLQEHGNLSPQHRSTNQEQAKAPERDKANSPEPPLSDFR